MKTQKLLVVAAIVCLLVGASGAAMAEELRECPNGFINGGEYETIALNLDFQDCVIVGVSVTTPAGVRVINPGNLVMMSSYVAGVVRVERNDDDGESAAAILYSLVKDGNIVTINLNEADIRWNTVKNGNIRVTDRDDTPSTFAEVIQNRVKGNIVVRKAASADVKGNRTIGGNIRCVDNILTDAFENEAIGGRVNCSRDPFSPEPEFE